MANNEVRGLSRIAEIFRYERTGWLNRSKIQFDRSKTFPLQIRQRHETQSAFMTGDIGTGKSTIQRGILHQAKARGAAAIIHDPHREFVAEFYDAANGDIILNPLDQRRFFWTPGDELTKGNEPLGLLMARSLFPIQPGDQPFFMEQSQALFAFLAAYYRPTGRELGDWMIDETIIDAKVKGTEFEGTLTNNAAGMRHGILGTFNKIGPALRLLPDKEDCAHTFSTTDWSQHRKGWIFVTNTIETRAALKPLQSMWIDLLVARILSMGQPRGLPFVWLMLDEIAALNKLPSVKIAVTESRKAGMSVVMGFHGKNELDGVYGEQDASTMVSQAKTQIVLRTSDKNGAEWASGLIGDVEIERVRETRPAHEFLAFGRGHSYSTDRHIERLVLPSEIHGLPDLSGYLLYEDMLVPLDFTLLPKKTDLAPGYLEAPMRPRWEQPKEAVSEPPPATVDAIPDKQIDNSIQLGLHPGGVYGLPL